MFSLQWEIAGFYFISWCILNWSKQLRWNCRSSVFLAVGVRHLMGSQPACLVSVSSHKLSTTPSLSAFVYPSSAFVWTWCDQYVCCVDVQGVNGHYRKVTEWGRKDSIVYRHSPWSWRWTTMVSLLSFLCICTGHLQLYWYLPDSVHSKILTKTCTTCFGDHLSGISHWGLISFFILLFFHKATHFGICIGSSRGKKLLFNLL